MATASAQHHRRRAAPRRPNWNALVLNLFQETTTLALASVIRILANAARTCPAAAQALELACIEMHCRTLKVIH